MKIPGPHPRMDDPSHSNHALMLCALLLSGCGRCSPTTTTSNTDQHPPVQPPRPLPSALPAPKPLAFKPFRGARTGIALPSGCSFRGLIAEAELPDLLRFAAEPRSLGRIIVAQAEGNPPKLSAVAAFEQPSSGEPGELKNAAPFPWYTAEDMPIFTRTEEHGFLAANEVPTDETSARVELLRGGMAETLGEGDHFHAIDITCEKSRCALLTTRMARVAAPGAAVWLGDVSKPLSEWTSIEIDPPGGDISANPIGFAHGSGNLFENVENTKNGGPSDQIATGSNTAQNSANLPGAFPPPIVLATKSELFFLQIGADAKGEAAKPRELARLPAPHGTLDAVSAPLPLAMVYGNPVNESGCIGRPQPPPEPNDQDDQDEPAEAGTAPEAPEIPAPTANKTKGAAIRFERKDAPPHEFAVPVPPMRGVLRPIEQGVLALWIAPLTCGSERHVVYGLVLDHKGEPLGTPIPIADAAHFAAASSGNTVDLWLQRESRLTYAPLRCTAAHPPENAHPPEK